jgi:hypothetical protein
MDTDPFEKEKFLLLFAFPILVIILAFYII